MAFKLLVLISCMSIAFGLKSFWYNVHDGQNRIQAMTEADLGEGLAAKPLAVVWVRTNPGQDKAIEDVTERMLQHSAQILEQRGGFVGSLTVAPESTIATEYGLESNMVLVFKNGRQMKYSGYRSSEVFIAFLDKLGDSVLTLIDGKATKKVFDRLPSTKVVGYFDPTDPALADFEAAAQEYLGEIPFYVAHDPIVAQHLKMNASGEIHVILPYDKQRHSVPQIPATLDDIRIFLYDHSQAVFKKLAMDNIHSLWENVNDNINSVVAFSSRTTAAGPPFYKVLKHVVRTFINETALQVTVIETDQFPLVLSHWENLYNISLSQPALGLVNLTDNNSTWFDITSMQLLANVTDKQALMSSWFTDILQGVIRVDGLEPAVPIVDPVPEAVPDVPTDQVPTDQDQANQAAGQTGEQATGAPAEQPKTEL